MTSYYSYEYEDLTIPADRVEEALQKVNQVLKDEEDYSLEDLSALNMDKLSATKRSNRSVDVYINEDNDHKGIGSTEWKILEALAPFFQEGVFIDEKAEGDWGSDHSRHIFWEGKMYTLEGLEDFIGHFNQDILLPPALLMKVFREEVERLIKAFYQVDKTREEWSHAFEEWLGLVRSSVSNQALLEELDGKEEDIENHNRVPAGSPV
jgi:hypothetical protein